MSSIFGNTSDTNVYAKKRLLNPENEYFGSLINPTVVSGNITVTPEELGYLSGTYDFIQDQLDSKVGTDGNLNFTGNISFAGAVSFNDIDTPPHCPAPPIHGTDLCNKAYVDAQAPLTSYQLFCNYSEVDGLPFTSYKLLSPTENYTAQTVSFSVNTTPVLVAGFFSTKALLQIGNSISPGNWTLNSYSNVTSINDQAHVGVYFQVIGITIPNYLVETVLATSSVSPLISVVSPYVGTYSNIITFSTTDITAYDVIGIKIYVVGNVSAFHTGSMFFQGGTSYTSLLTSFATTQASNILNTTNTWTGINTFNAATTFGADATLNGQVILDRSAPVITSSSTTNDLVITPGVGRSIRLNGTYSLGGGNDCVLNQTSISPYNRLITSVSSNASSYNGQVQSGDNILIFGNNGTAGIPATGFVGLWASGTRTGLRMTTTDVNLEGGSGSMTFRMNTATAMTISNSAVATFTNAVNASILGNAATVTNGLYSNVTYNNPPWLGTLDAGKLVGDVIADNVKSKIGGIFGLTIDNDVTNTGNLTINQKNASGNTIFSNAGVINKFTFQFDSTETFYLNAGNAVSRRPLTVIYNPSLSGDKMAQFVNSSGSSAGSANDGIRISVALDTAAKYNALTQIGDHIVYGGSSDLAGTLVLGPWTNNRTGIRMTQTNTTVEAGQTMNLRANNVDALSIDNAGVVAFSSSPTCPTPASNDNSTKVATTAFVKNAAGAIYRLPDRAFFCAATLDWDVAKTTNVSLSNLVANMTLVWLNAGDTFSKYEIICAAVGAKAIRFGLFGPIQPDSVMSAPYVTGSDTGGYYSGAGAGPNGRQSSVLGTAVTITTSGVYFIWLSSNVTQNAGNWYTSTAYASAQNGNYNTAGATCSVTKPLRSFTIPISASEAPSAVTSIGSRVPTALTQTTYVMLGY